MIIGPLTIRRTKDVEAEQARQARAKAVRNKLVALLLSENTHQKAVLRRWGLLEPLMEAGGSKGSKPPKGAVASVL